MRVIAVTTDRNILKIKIKNFKNLRDYRSLGYKGARNYFRTKIETETRAKGQLEIWGR